MTTQLETESIVAAPRESASDLSSGHQPSTINHQPASTSVDFFLPYQRRWIEDQSILRICEKSRQIGMTYADAYDSVLKAADLVHGMDVWVSSRDEDTARLYLQQCKRWAKVLNHVADDLGIQIVDSKKDIQARVLRFPRGFSIYCLSSATNAIVGRTGHIKLDEFALHENQRELYGNASPCILWGGQLSIISTQRGVDTVFNEIIRSVKEQNNPFGLSHHRITIHDAVEQGLVERINAAARRNESRGAFLQRVRKQCLDEEQWLREYCCTPMDENTAFLEWSLITACEHPNCLKPFSYLESSSNPSLYVGVDVARKEHLCVIDVGEKIGDVIWDRLRIELQNKTFAEIEHELWRLLALRPVKRCCIDATGLGMQLAERAKERFGWKAEPITFTPTVKEDLAFELRRAFEDRKLRIDPNPALRADLRGIRKQVTSSGNIRFVAESEDGHCDRFWAKALRQHAARRIHQIGGGLAI